MQLNIDPSEIDEFLKAVGALHVQKTLDRSIKKAIFKIERTAKQNTTVDKGFLVNSYETKFEPLEGRLRNFREYAPFVHDGHKQQVGRYVPAIGARLKQPFVKGNPWMSRTLRDESENVRRIFSDDLEKMLEDLVK